MRPDDRPGLRELVAKAINSSDLSQTDARPERPIQEAAIDRIGALAFADPLGGLLWALKWAHDAGAYPRALSLLTHRSKRACGDFTMRPKLCRTALDEWLYDVCIACLGRGHMSNIAAERHCQECHGSGKRRISEVWRAIQLGLDREQYRKWEPRYVAVQRKLVDAEIGACYDLRRILRGEIPAGFFAPSAIAQRPVEYRLALIRLGSTAGMG